MGLRLKVNKLLLSLTEWVNEVNSRTSSDLVELVVEGPRDERALKLLGVRANFTRAKDLMTEIRERGGSRVKGKSFIIMTDFDREGRIIHSKLKDAITRCGGSVDERPRAEYRRKGLPPLIEELEGFLKRRFPNWDMIVSFRSE
ncbi:MAG: hypothetical protein NZ992_04220 [Candidatus Korarchaeum sp.]|nr:hypothetical protein [Candidatus Korarchaeum sp.]MDW8036217.1 hypothetical protein [Candidatus Korarchaeum sp.]